MIACVPLVPFAIVSASLVALWFVGMAVAASWWTGGKDNRGNR